MAKLNIQALLQDESAGVRSVHPGLQATATLTPWQRQPLHALQAQIKDLNLAAFWPELPTTQISGQVKAQPPDADSAPATEQAWELQLALTNAVSGPWDLGKLPLSAIQLQANASAQLVDVTHLQAQVGAGTIQGSGRWQPGQTTSRAQWTVSALPLHELHSALAPALMSGTMQWQPTPDAATALALNLNSQPLPGPGHAKAHATPRLTIQTLKTQGVWNGSRLQLSELWLRAAGAEVRGQGQLTPSPLNVTAQLRVRAPGLDGDLQGTMAADQGSGQLNLQATDLTQLTPWLQAMPMLGDSVPTQWKLTGDARLTTRWHGGWARPGGPELQAQFSNTRTTLATDSRQPALQAQVTRLTLDGDLHSARISATTELTRGDLSAKLNLQAHTDMPEPGKGQLTLDQWGLHLQQAQAPQALTLRSPQAVTLNWDSDQWQVGPGEVLVQAQARSPANTPAPTQAPVRLNWQQVAMRQGVLISDGQVQQLALNWLDTAGDLLGNSGDRWLSDAGLAGDLVLNGRWQVSWPLKAPAQGQAAEPKLLLELQRQQGDLQIRNPGASDDPTGWVATGLQRAQVSVRTQGQALQANLKWDSRLAGQLEAQFQTQLQPLNGTWTLTPKAPLQGSLNARLPELSLWSPLVAPPGWRAQGRATLAAQTTGTLGQPNWNGELVASDLGLKSAVEGLEFGHGRLVARLSGEHIDITELMLEGPGGAKQGGTFSGTGRAQWTTGTNALPQQPRIALQAKASKLRLSARADRRLTLSGDLSASLENQLLTLKGDLAVDQALFILPDETAPTLGDDVILRQTQVATVEKGSRVKTDVLVNIALGDKLEVRGQGLKTRLGGKVSLVSNPANPALRVLGEVRTLDGSYRAYGQQLSISEGVIRFSGPYDDPSLSILAVRPASAFKDSDTQVVGVKITGSARAPLVRLYANPDMPDSEKLAWLVLGRKASGSGAEAAILQQAALALLSGNGGAMDASLSSRLGLDDISFRGSSTQADGTTQAAGVALGKRLSSRLYMAFETSLNTAVGTVSLFYDVSKRLTLRARAGEENAIDLIFTVQHD
jgi:translocation and assembly module TamB